ncbi:MAG: hypothetical protein OHK0036_14050 [Bacteroidia bacterium]
MKISNKINSMMLFPVELILIMLILLEIKYCNNLITKYTVNGILFLILGFVFIIDSILTKKEGHRPLEGFYGGWLRPLTFGIFLILCSIYCFIVLIFDL